MKRICIQLTDAQYDLLKKQATEGVSIASLIRQALQSFYSETKGNIK